MTVGRRSRQQPLAFAEMVGRLGDKATRREAIEYLMAAAATDAAARAALRRGLSHDDWMVRTGCCVVLDHHYDADALPELLANLQHPEGQVRKWALHVLGCDRCKEGECRPGEAEVLPVARHLLATDRSRHVRGAAASLLGAMAARHPEVIPDLEHARDHDQHPTVKKIAGWYAPGGACHRRIVEQHEVALSRRHQRELRPTCRS